MPVKFYLEPLRCAGVIREKPILSKYISRCHAFAWQRTVRYFTASWTYLFLQSEKLQLANLLQNCYFCLIQKTISNSLLWLIVKIFFVRLFCAPLACCARGQLRPQLRHWSVHPVCLQHVRRDAERRAGLSVTADTYTILALCKIWGSISLDYRLVQFTA